MFLILKVLPKMSFYLLPNMNNGQGKYAEKKYKFLRKNKDSFYAKTLHPGSEYKTSMIFRFHLHALLNLALLIVGIDGRLTTGYGSH
jgi:hypothetical protein